MATIHSPYIGRRDRNGRCGVCDLEGSNTYGVGGGKLWYHRAKKEQELHEPVEVTENGRKETSRNWKLEAGGCRKWRREEWVMMGEWPTTTAEVDASLLCSESLQITQASNTLIATHRRIGQFLKKQTLDIYGSLHTKIHPSLEGKCQFCRRKYDKERSRQQRQKEIISFCLKALMDHINLPVFCFCCHKSGNLWVIYVCWTKRDIDIGLN